MKKSILSLCCLIAFSQIQSQDLQIPFGSNVQIDGHFGANEWQDAAVHNFQITPSRSTQVYIKQDGMNLNIAYAGSLETGGAYFPEIMIDVNHGRTPYLEPDDWWFHVSASDCDFQGAYGNYANCQLIRPNWKAAPNFMQTGSPVDTVEIQIPFSSIGVQALDSIGIGFFLNNFSVVLSMSPSSSHLVPSTWYTTQLALATKIDEVHLDQGQKLEIYPNPSSGQFVLNFSEQTQEIGRVIVRDILGNEVYRAVPKKERMDMDLRHLRAGVYFVEWLSSSNRSTQKLVIH